jgi:hypothetical protein
VVRRVICPRCKAKAQESCFSGLQFGGRYIKPVPNSHLARWKAAIDAGHMPDQMADLGPA